MTGRPLRALALALVFTALAAPVRVAADDLDEELRRVSERLDTVARNIDDVTASRSLIAAQIRAADEERETLQAVLAESEAALTAISASVDAASQRLAEARTTLHGAFTSLAATRSQIAATRGAALEGARASYIHGSRDIAVLSLTADRITQVAIGAEYLERAGALHAGALATLLHLEEQERTEQASIRDQVDRLDLELASVQRVRTRFEAVRDDVAARRAQLEAALALDARLLATLDEEIADFEEELDGLAAEQRTIKTRITQEQRARVRAVSASGFVRPVPGAITSGFGRRYHPVLGYYRMHTGVDMAAAAGRPIKAAKAGTVIFAGTWGGYGRTVIIDHGDGMSTLYAHQSALSVSYGDTVAAGEVVGRAGSSGLATGPHLHFEVRLGGEPVDPAPYLEG